MRLEYFAEVAAARRLESAEEAQALHGQHIWRDEVIAERFEWGGEKAIFALAVRVFRLPETVELPMLAAYGGCKSWIDLDRDIRTAGAAPVLTEDAFAAKLDQFDAALTGAPVRS